MSSSNCAACGRSIDATARLCPYCGANPGTGKRPVDTQAILNEVFRPRDVSASENVIEYARQRQGVVIAVSLFVAFLILGGLHQFASRRNADAVTDAPAVTLAEVTDLTKKADDVTPVPMPKLDFFYDGNPQKMRTYVVERGAVVPPEVQAAQQAAAATAAVGSAPQPRAGVKPPSR